MGNIHLHCNNSQFIHVVNATVGLSKPTCRRGERCCPSPNDDIIEGTPQNVQHVKNKCDGLHKCDVNVPQLTIKDKTSDYDSVNYICSNHAAGNLALYCLIIKVIRISYTSIIYLHVLHDDLLDTLRGDYIIVCR